MSKLSNVVKNDVVKKAVYDKLDEKVNDIDTSRLVLKTKEWHRQSRIRKTNIPDVTDLIEKAKLIELENKIPDVCGLGTKSTLTAVENEILDVTSLVKKQIMTQKIVKLKRNLLIINMTRLLPLQSLIL